jgi:hypothetical protein
MKKIDADKITLIGIHGLLGSGKDTVASMIVNLFCPVKYKQYAFAWPIKEACKIIFDFTDRDMADRILKERIHPFWGISPRKAMQTLGTEFGRDMIRKDIWILRAESEIQKNAFKLIGTVISDVRFENEADIIRNRNGVIIHVIRNTETDLEKEVTSHGSEQGILVHENDIILNNNGTFQDLQKNVKELFKPHINME